MKVEKALPITASLHAVGYPVFCYPSLVKKFNCPATAIFVSRFLFLDGKQKDEEGWIYKSQEEIELETGLTESMQRRARKLLRQNQILEERRRPTEINKKFKNLLHYRFHWQTLDALLSADEEFVRSYQDHYLNFQKNEPESQDFKPPKLEASNLEPSSSEASTLDASEPANLDASETPNLEGSIVYGACVTSDVTSSVCVSEIQHTHSSEDFSKKSKPSKSKTSQKSLKKIPDEEKAKNTRPPRSGRSPQSISFAQSPYLDPEAFARLLTEVGYPRADPEHYYQKISLYAQSEGLLKSDWKAYVQLWLQDDAKKNKLQFRKVSPSTKANPDLEIQAEFSRLQSDLAEGVFSEAAHLEGILERLRQLWREASDPLREKIEAFSSQVQTQIQNATHPKAPAQKLTSQPKSSKLNPTQTQNPRTLRKAMRERLQAIKPPDDTS